jgi:hypothetical protein
VSIIIHPGVLAHPSIRRHRSRDEIEPRLDPPLDIRSARKARLAPSALLEIADSFSKDVDLDFADLSLHYGRDYRLLERTEQFEAWIIAWGSSSFLGLHDHGRSNGAFFVVEGAWLQRVSATFGEPAPHDGSRGGFREVIRTNPCARNLERPRESRGEHPRLLPTPFVHELLHSRRVRPVVT